MKKIISLLLCMVLICVSFGTTASAENTEISDDLINASYMFSHSDNLIFESKDKLASYQNPNYVTCSNGVLELVYELDNLAGFSITTLNYKGSENISIYSSEKSNEEFDLVSNISREEESLGSNWQRIVYSGNVENKKYLKIVINQATSKYIRVDKVNLFSKSELKAVSTVFENDGVIQTDDLLGVDCMKITFNQILENDIPELSIKNNGIDEQVVGGVLENDNKTVKYTFDKLSFKIYDFSANDFSSITKVKCNYTYSYGCDLVVGISDSVHISDEIPKQNIISKCINYMGDEVSISDKDINLENTDVAFFSDDILKFSKFGTFNLDISFKLNNKAIRETKQVSVCSPKALDISDDEMQLTVGENRSFAVGVILSDGSVVSVTDCVAQSGDNSVAAVQNNVVTATGKGSTFVTVTADYFGEKLTAYISVGVGEPPQKAIENVEISVNRSEITVGQSIAPVTRCYLNSGDEVDSLSYTKVFYTDNNRVLDVRENGTIGALNEGNANIYAVVDLGGMTKVTNKININVLPRKPDSAYLTLPSYTMILGQKMPVSAYAFDNLGDKIEGFNTELSSDNQNTEISDGYVIAKKTGESVINAKIRYDGTEINSEPVTINVVQSTAMVYKDFISDNNWDNVLSHSDNVIIYGNVGAFASDDNFQNNNIVFESKNEIKTLEATAYYINDRGADDIQFWVSGDNVDFVRIPEDDMSVKTTVDSVNTAWSYVNIVYSGALLDGAKYLKVVFDRPASEHTQGIRLHNVHIKSDVKPKVLDAYFVDKYGKKTSTLAADKLMVIFDGNVSDESLKNVTLVDQNENIVSEEAVLEGNICSIPVDCENIGNYKLIVRDVCNEFGNKIDDYSKDMYLNSKNIITVDDIKTSTGNVSARLTNNTTDNAEGIVLTVIYDNNGMFKNIYIDSNVNIPPGVNRYYCPKSFENANTAKVFVWRDLFDLDLY